uniref:Uncharacterized protein n=1 Tax=Trypanosoma congolense (strain IL3000) TaxID=1068625 RepID=G0UXI4_TRYCI|nr:conserved hypothetical protein [Trypanosoma congolense IL3000]
MGPTLVERRCPSREHDCLVVCVKNLSCFSFFSIAPLLLPTSCCYFLLDTVSNVFCTLFSFFFLFFSFHQARRRVGGGRACRMLRLSRAHLRIAFVTDVEGDLTYFARYVDWSKVVSWKDGRLTFRDSASHFIYGGDAFDRGCDISFSKALMAFQDEYPSRVHLMLGNRDINKMVFGSPVVEALQHTHLLPSLAQKIIFPGVLMCPDGREKGVSYEDFLRERNMPLVTTKATLIQWMLTHKMGSAHTFEHRRKELCQLGYGEQGDEGVADSFIGSAQPGGVYYEYLKRGKIATIIDGILFVHGAVVDENVGVVPRSEDTSESGALSEDSASNFVLQRQSAEEWVSALNGFKEVQFQQWSAGGKGAALRQYALPFEYSPHSVVVHSLTAPGWPRYLGLGGVEFLNRSGISVVCGGHQPTGDSPSVVQQPGLLSISADNSYCGGDGTRGSSVVEILFDDDGAVGISGRRVDGATYSFMAPDGVVGRHLGDGWWVKLKVSDDLYEVQQTCNSYRDKQVRFLSRREVDACLASSSGTVVGGEPPERWTREQLMPIPSAIKTRRVQTHRIA